jgi:hypothetical protein
LEDTNGADRADTESAVRAVEAAIAVLSVQLDRERSRVDLAERQLEHERQVAEQLRAALTDAVAAERIAAGEAAALRSAADRRRAWGLWRRLGWAAARGRGD